LLAALDDPADAAAQRATPIVRDAIAAYRDTLTPAAARA
ncbi:formate dehydrogenase subunit delta, partial [Burkholderia sp. MR1-5-21]